MKSSHFLAFAALLGLSGTVSAAWTRLPYVDSTPVNLAAKSVAGTKILASTGVENSAALISGDPASSAHLAAGKSECTIQLAGQQVLEIVCFTNDGVEGKVTCAGSPDEKNWTTLGRETFAAGDRLVAVTFASAQAKYLSISVESAQGGSIRALKVYGAGTSKDYVLKNSSDGPPANLAGGAGGAHAIYAYPAPSNVGELGAPENVFKFPSTGDKYRTIVYDLGTPRTIREFSTAYSQHPVRLEVFAFQDLPEKKDWRGKLTLDPAIFDETRPVASGEDARGVGHIKLIPGKPVLAQYVALRFEPNYLHASNGGMTENSWAELVQLGFGSAAPLLDSLNLLPQVQLTAGGDGGFTVCDINIGGSGSASSGNGPPGNTPGNQGGATGTGTGSTDTVGAPPYISGTPGSPAAGSGGLPGTGTTGTSTGTTTVNPVTVAVGGGGGGGGTSAASGSGTNAGTPSSNNPTTTSP
jgi:hypothetical protein